MRKTASPRTGVTYIGPRTFTLGFCAACAIFLGLAFGLDRFTDALETAPNAVAGVRAQELPMATPVPVRLTPARPIAVLVPAPERIAITVPTVRAPTVPAKAILARTRVPITHMLAPVPRPSAAILLNRRRKLAVLGAPLRMKVAVLPAAIRAKPKPPQVPVKLTGVTSPHLPASKLLVPFTPTQPVGNTRTLEPSAADRGMLLIATPPIRPGSPSSTNSP